MKRWPNVVCPVSMPSTENFTTSGSSVSGPKVAMIECSGRTQESEPDLAERCAPAHRFRPREGSDDDRQNLGEHVDRGAARLFDQRDVEIALWVALDLGFIERFEAGRFQETLHGRIGCADFRSAAFGLQIRLPRRNAVHGQRQPPRRRERLCALIDEAFGDELVGDHAAQIVRRLRLHARGDFLGEQFEQKIRHQTALPASV